MTYRFVGSYAEIADLRIERYGEKVELAQPDAEAAVLHGAALLPEAEFQKLNITDAELREHFSVGLHPLAPAGFLAKRDASWAALRAFREQLSAATAAQE